MGAGLWGFLGGWGWFLGGSSYRTTHPNKKACAYVRVPNIGSVFKCKKRNTHTHTGLGSPILTHTHMDKVSSPSSPSSGNSFHRIRANSTFLLRTLPSFWPSGFAQLFIHLSPLPKCPSESQSKPEASHHMERFVSKGP